MNKYFIRLLVSFLIATGITWFGSSFIINSAKNFFNAFNRIETILTKSHTYDCLMLGSSRMKNNVNPKIIDSILSINSFNAGTNGGNIFEIKMLLEGYLLKSPAPKMVVVSLDIFSLISSNNIAFTPTYLTAYTAPPVYTNLKEDGINVSLYKFLPPLRVIEFDDYYKGAVFRNLKGDKELKEGDFYYKGFESNTTDTISTATIPPSYSIKMSEKAVLALQDFITICKKYKIKLVLSYAPEYKQINQKAVTNIDTLFNLYKSISLKYNIPFLRNDSLSLNSNGAYFANVGHLNRVGANIYSIILARQLDSIIVTNQIMK